MAIFRHAIAPSYARPISFAGDLSLAMSRLDRLGLNMLSGTDRHAPTRRCYVSGGRSPDVAGFRLMIAAMCQRFADGGRLNTQDKRRPTSADRARNGLSERV